MALVEAWRRALREQAHSVGIGSRLGGWNWDAKNARAIRGSMVWETR